MKKIEAELWPNECGGYLCSHCGTFYDDCYELPPIYCGTFYDDCYELPPIYCGTFYDDCYELPPIYCETCGEEMFDACNMLVDKEYRLSCDGEFVDFDEYPVWLKDLRNGRLALDDLKWK